MSKKTTVSRDARGNMITAQEFDRLFKQSDNATIDIKANDKSAILLKDGTVTKYKGTDEGFIKQ